MVREKYIKCPMQYLPLNKDTKKKKTKTKIRTTTSINETVS